MYCIYCMCVSECAEIIENIFDASVTVHMCKYCSYHIWHRWSPTERHLFVQAVICVYPCVRPCVLGFKPNLTCCSLCVCVSVCSILHVCKKNNNNNYPVPLCSALCFLMYIQMAIFIFCWKRRKKYVNVPLLFLTNHSMALIQCMWRKIIVKGLSVIEWQCCMFTGVTTCQKMSCEQCKTEKARGCRLCCWTSK